MLSCSGAQITRGVVGHVPKQFVFLYVSEADSESKKFVVLYHVSYINHFRRKVGVRGEGGER